MPFAIMDLGAAPPPWILAPFVILLGAIAVGPLLTPRLWHDRYHIFSVCMSAIVFVYYLVGRREAAPLIQATPWRNVVFLAMGGLLANLLGTTGAAMLLIRPWIRMNRYRITGFHIVFFIFIVANVGGCLTPVGDPPLFLGYLRGVPFFWTLEHLWPDWLTVVGLLLLVFYILDSRNFRRAPRPVREKETGRETFRLEGARNAWFVAVILGAVLLRGAGASWGIPEAIMGAAAWFSHRFTDPSIRERNEFSFDPLKEVGWLFFGIFATLVPVIHTLSVHAGSFGHPSDLHYYFMTG
ncbi:MAG: sodium:proton antiporter, partial [Verrucomicrobia bacterium]|nr:sodium:proton antiporter [Verrucomicrobiota bacterium]